MLGNVENIRQIISRGGDPNQLGGYGTILANATWYNNLQAVQVLLELGAKPNLNKGEALLNAVNSPNQNDESPDVVRVLAAKGADVNRIYNVQSEIPEASPLMIAIFHGYVKTAEALIELGADLKFQSKKGQSAFSLAAENGLLKLGQMMLEHGFKPNPRNKVHAAFVKKLKKAPAKTNNYLEKRFYLMPSKTRSRHTSGTADLKKILGTDHLPLCPNPAVNLLTLDLRDFKELPPKVRKIGLLHIPFYYCSDCNGEPDALDFKISQSGRLKLLNDYRGKSQNCSKEAACGPAKPSFLKVLSAEPDERCGIHIGGSPRWCQSPQWAFCPKCGENGFYIGSISQSLLPPGYGGPDNVIYIFTCGDCRTEMIVRQMT